MTEPEEIMDFYLDKPFVFAIMDNQTGAVFSWVRSKPGPVIDAS